MLYPSTYPGTMLLGIPYRSTGETLRLHLRDQHDHVVAHEILDDPNVYRLGREALDGAVVLDVGACFGAFTLFAILNGAAKVVSVEPHPDNLAALEHNVFVENRGLPVTIRPVAAGRGGRQVNVRGDSVRAWTETGLGAPVVERSLSDLVADCGGKVDVCKVDCEGAEYDLILGASSETLDQVGRFTMEWHGPAEHPNLRPRLGEMMEHLAETHAVSMFGRPSAGGYLFAGRL